MSNDLLILIFNLMKHLVFMLSIFSFVVSPSAKATKLKIATLEWPPYACEKCPEGGATLKILKKYFKDSNIEVDFKFFPWARAVKMAQRGEVNAVWPCWPSDAKQYSLEMSPMTFSSPIAFVGKKLKVQSVKKINDLASSRLGAVVGYGYPDSVMDILNLAGKGVQLVVSDQINIEKLFANRIDFLVIDLINYKYLRGKHFSNIKIETEVVENSIVDLPFVFGSDKKNAKLFLDLFSDSSLKKRFGSELEVELKYYFK